MSKKLTILVLCVMLCVVNCDAALAGGGYMQDVQWTCLWEYTSPGYSFNDGQTISFEAIAKNASYNGTFEIELQKQGLFGVWSKVGYSYIVNYSSGQSYGYGEITGPVSGYWFKVYWAMNGTGTYRFVLKNPSISNTTVYLYNIIWRSY